MDHGKLHIKHLLYENCKLHLLQRIEAAQAAIESLQSEANEETKSSFGDKYETGRAMMQLEIEKYSQQLSEVLKMRSALERIDVSRVTDQVIPGSVAITNSGNFFVSVSAGQLIVEDLTFVAISPSSPVGARLLNLRPNESFFFHDKKYTILDVY